jgi:hypothetical protein
MQEYQPNAAVGDVPDQWDPNIEGYELVDILRLVIFYNEAMEIDPGDIDADRRRKVLNWLAEQE